MMEHDTGDQYSSEMKQSVPAHNFRSFWRKSDRQSVKHDAVASIQQDSSSKRTDRSSLVRFLRSTSSASGIDDRRSSEFTGGQKRRQQIYQAQKRHRNRKAGYVQNLEAEIARIRQIDAVANSEKDVLARENQAMRGLLASHALDAGFGSANRNPNLDLPCSVSVNIRFDEIIQQERTFLDTDGMGWTSESFRAAADPTQPASRGPKGRPVKGDSLAALDFILALEWPCRRHVTHPGINPEAEAPVACNLGLFHGHALTTTASEFQSAQPPPFGYDTHAHCAGPGDMSSQAGPSPGATAKWQLPHSEIDKLVTLSETLELDDEHMTPAQAYSAVRKTVSSDRMLKPVLKMLKASMAGLVRCLGLGAVMPADKFWQHLDGINESLER